MTRNSEATYARNVGHCQRSFHATDKPGVGTRRPGFFASGGPIQKKRAVLLLLRSSAELEHPEQRLWFAVLYQAIVDATREPKAASVPMGAANKDIRKAHYSRVSNSSESREFFRRGRFIAIAYHCGLDPEWVAGKLRNYCDWFTDADFRRVLRMISGGGR